MTLTFDLEMVEVLGMRGIIKSEDGMTNHSLAGMHVVPGRGDFHL